MQVTGYQQGILYATGSYTGGKYSVRNVDRWYCDAVQPLFGTSVYMQINQEREKPQFVVKSNRVHRPELKDVTDNIGFCRAMIEIHGVLDTNVIRGAKRLRLRIYGDEFALRWIMDHLPAGQKKIQNIRNSIENRYTGETSAIYYQSEAEIRKILDYIAGNPSNSAVWEKWENILKQKR